MTAFDSVLAEAAWAVAGHGFAETFGDLSAGDPSWNAFVHVSSTVLLNLDETELRERYDDVWRADGIDGRLVWIKQTDDGQVSVVMHGSDAGPRSGTDLVGRAWDEASA